MKNTVTLKLFILMITFGIILITLQFYNLRKEGIENALKKANAVAEVVKSGLTAHMVNGNMDQREVFLKSISSTKNIKKLWIIRGDNVIKQYGKSTLNDLIKDKIDAKVIQNGKIIYKRHPSDFLEQ